MSLIARSHSRSATLRMNPSRCISRKYRPAMIVFPVPGSSASRNRSRGWGSIAPYTAFIWCA